MLKKIALLLWGSLLFVTCSWDLDSANSFTVTGTLTDSDGSPVSGGTVILEDDSEHRAATDSNGNFEFDDLSAGNYSVSGEIDGWIVVYEEDSYLSLRWEESVEIELTAYDLSESLPISVIQGSNAKSSLDGESVVDIEGVVTKLNTADYDGFFMQTATIDDYDFSSSCGIFVYTEDEDGSGTVSTVPYDLAVGDLVKVSGTVTELQVENYLGYSDGLLTVTTLTDPVAEVLTEDYTTTYGEPDPIVIGDSASADISPGDITTAEEMIDFMEAMEGMRVTVESPVAVGPESYSNMPVILSGVTYDLETEFSDNYGLLIHEDNLNPERMFIYYEDFDDVVLPGTTFNNGGDVTGVVNYTGDGVYTIEPTDSDDIGEEADTSYSTVSKETTTVTHTDGTLRVASYNVENFGVELDDDGDQDTDSRDDQASELAEDYVDRLLSPDIMVMVEMGDDYGSTVYNENTKYTYYVPDGNTSAEGNFEEFADSIYSDSGFDGDESDDPLNYVDVEPEDGEEGGKPGMNIRVGVMYRSDRVTFTQRGDANYDDGVAPTLDDDGNIQLTYNPGRIIDDAFDGSRRPVVAEFDFEDGDGENHRIIVIGVHFSSKGSDDPYYGEIQPAVCYSEESRIEQAEAVGNFVTQCLSLDPDANIIVAGDFNDYAFSDAAQVLISTTGLNDLTGDYLDSDDCYTYSYYGNSQQLDLMLVSDNLYGATSADGVDIVHMNSEVGWENEHSDHDAIVSRFAW
ncbi:MAG: carboxypeptidase regulatory-like domain-containing protein [Spirochaetales bacterium]|nr:carboxypeptidase regulatory-like domain-containing protein [Spirochaetales bacterium]